MSSSKGFFVISDLRERPEFATAVADRVWRAWWQGKGYPLDYIEGRVAESLDRAAVPFAVVAHEEGRFLGTASVIPSDLDELPEYNPWVAAVWVDPEDRQRGVGAALVRKAAEGAFDSGANLVYLCALPEKQAFYERLGWQRLEENVGKNGLTVLERVDIQDSHGLATLIQASFGRGGLGERSSSDFERSPVGSDGAAFAGQAHGSWPNGGR